MFGSTLIPIGNEIKHYIFVTFGANGSFQFSFSAKMWFYKNTDAWKHFCCLHWWKVHETHQVSVCRLFFLYKIVSFSVKSVYSPFEFFAQSTKKTIKTTKENRFQLLYASKKKSTQSSSTMHTAFQLNDRYLFALVPIRRGRIQRGIPTRPIKNVCANAVAKTMV